MRPQRVTTSFGAKQCQLSLWGWLLRFAIPHIGRGKRQPAGRSESEMAPQRLENIDSGLANGAASGPPFRSPSPRQDREQQERDNVGDLDRRIDRGAGGVLVGVADRIAGDGGLVGL
jgi:hypothetical protein